MSRNIAYLKAEVLILGFHFYKKKEKDNMEIGRGMYRNVY